MADKKVYQDWSDSAAKVRSIASDSSLELWQKSHLVAGAYAGLALEGLKSKHRHKILGGFSKMNGILSKYTLNTYDEYEIITEEDLREIIRIVLSLEP
ncbi:hypothetical protein [Alkalimarinus alittae]|uniref:HEPN domain-containing protein n=1 Tax=Alkalimarinus alittae TaxID=2961619 RepID=A0ABY6N5E5_9ALTE|nr:hypothetical protein [Alkalimarinus alittae]UZE97304.1 hypothetical protein NKI27_06005 [Alkalimarinus alittae]